MKFLRDMWEGLSAFGKRKTWEGVGKGLGMLADTNKRQQIMKQAKDGVEDIKAGKHGDALANFVNLTAKTPIGQAAHGALDSMAAGDYLGAAKSIAGAGGAKLPL